MDESRLLEHLTHYLAMFFAVWIVMSTVWSVYGRLALPIEFGILALVCVSYMVLVRWLGIAPGSWQGK